MNNAVTTASLDNKHRAWLVFAVAVVAMALITVAMYDGLEYMVRRWQSMEEYSHGFMLPVVALYLAWLRFDPRDIDAAHLQRGPGLLLLVMGLLLGFLGEMSAIFEVIQYGYVISFFGVVIIVLGYRSFQRMLAPLLILFFMVPFPNFIYRSLSAQLQLWSSVLGVEFIRLFDIPVFLEGNVIDLGAMKLQVVEACSGLRYLFPLLSLSYICAYLFKAPLWQRGIVFLSAAPITLIMNSLRIGAIGVTVEYWGPEMAEGVLHDFEGWIMFMFSMGVLLLEIYCLSRLLKPRVPLMDRFQLDQNAEWSAIKTSLAKLDLARATHLMLALAVIFFALMKSLPGRAEVLPDRIQFREFPLRIGEWTGFKKNMEIDFQNQLNFTDYVLADYTSDRGDYLNFYVAYYDSQRKGRSVHSPRTCIPGGGWEMQGLEQVTFDSVMVNGQALTTNKVIIQRGDERSLVYYWFDQRGRTITNEYAVKWYIFQDALTKLRTDGALVRLVIPLRSGESNGIGAENEAAASKLAENFLRDMIPRLPDYIPR
ncbi:MAG TPA: VPLPA-CTERM-specific exosortase XrtD [Pseudomonadales bacterium]|nr:VPLPA-CTERM-specific exosortase XrtD [Pseudomonadales bacterium]